MNWFSTLNLRTLSLLTAILFGLAACGGRPDIGMRPGITAVADAELPVQTTQRPTALVETQRIAPLDSLMIDVFGVEGMEKREVVVDAGGDIAFPLAGRLSAVGLTPNELENSIRTALQRRYIRDPQVAVSVVKTNAMGTFTVEGAVNQPGIYPLTGRMTLLKAVAQARGTNDTSNNDAVLIFRTVDGVDYVGAYNLTAIRRGNYVDPPVFMDDKIVVDESRSRGFFKDLAPLLSAPLIAVLNRV